jgi:hypothetical protein
MAKCIIERFWPEIKAVASELLKQKRLTAEEVVRVFVETLPRHLALEKHKRGGSQNSAIQIPTIVH